MTRHWQWTKERYAPALGTVMHTTLYVRCTGSWISTGFVLVSVATLDGVEYRHEEITPKEPGMGRMRAHRQRAVREISRRVMAAA